MSDLISRQAAIEALRGYLVGKRCPDDGTLTCRLIENEVINKLPPIQPKLLQPWEVLVAQSVLSQPEIVRCKDCKHWKDSDGVFRRGIGVESKCPLNLHQVYEGTFFCGLAERREVTE